MKNNDKKFLVELRNVEGKILLSQVRLEYSKMILFEIQSRPEVLEDLLEHFDMDKEEFFAKLESVEENISFFDEALQVLRGRRR